MMRHIETGSGNGIDRTKRGEKIARNCVGVGIGRKKREIVERI